MGNLAKAAIQNDSEGMENAKSELKNAASDMMNATFNYGAKYTQIADDAEKRAWENN